MDCCERSRVASKQQIQEMATCLNPERLRESPMASEGAPIVGPDAAVESGNGRVLAIRQAYENGQGGAYRDSLIQNAESFGLTN